MSEGNDSGNTGSRSGDNPSGVTWERRMAALEQRFADLDSSLRSESERARGSAAALDQLFRELRGVMGDTRELTASVERLASQLGDVEAGGGIIPAPSVDLTPVLEAIERLGDSRGEEHDLRTRFDDLDVDFGRVVHAITTLRSDIAGLQSSNPDLTPVVDAVRQLVDRDADYSAVIDAVERSRQTTPELSSVIDSLRRIDEQMGPLRDDVQGLRAQQPDLSPLESVLDELRDRQVDLSPVLQELRELRSAQPDLTPVAEAVEGLRSSLSTEIRSIVQGMPDLAPLLDAADRPPPPTPPIDLGPVLAAIDELRGMLPDPAAVAAAASSSTPAPDLSPVLDEIRRLRTDTPDLAPIAEALQGLRTDRLSIDATIEAVEELRTGLPDAIQTRIDTQLAAATERQQALTESTRDILRHLAETQPDLDSLVGAVDELRAQMLAELTSIPSSADVAAITAAIERIDTTPADLTPVLAAIDSVQLARPAADAAAGIADALAAAQPDLTPILDELRSLRSSATDLDVISDSLQALRADRVAVDGAIEAIDELRTQLPDALQGRLDGLLATALERQQVAAEAARDELRRIDDRIEPMNLALQGVGEQLSRLEAVTTDQARDAAERRVTLESIAGHARDVAVATPAQAQRIDDLAADVRQLSTAPALQADVVSSIDAAVSRFDDVERTHADRLDALAAQVRTIDLAIAGGSDASDVAEGLQSLHDRISADRELLTATRADIVALGSSLRAELQAAADAPDLVAPLDDLHARIERLIEGATDELNKTLGARQLEQQSSLTQLIDRLPDTGSAIAELSRQLETLTGDGGSLTELQRDVAALAESSEHGLRTVRDAIDTRLASLDAARSSDAAALSEAIEQVGSQERSSAEALRVLVDDLAAARVDSDSLWQRAIDLMGSVSRSSDAQSSGIDELATSLERLSERAATDRDALEAVTESIADLGRQAGAVDTALTALTGSAPTVNDAIEPLHQALDALRSAADEHQRQLDVVASAIGGVPDIGSQIDESRQSLEQRIEALIDRQSVMQSELRELHPRLDTLVDHDRSAQIDELATSLAGTDGGLSTIGPRLDAMRTVLDATDARLVSHTTALDRVEQQSSGLVSAVAELAETTGRARQLDAMQADLATLNESLSQLDVPALTSRVAELSGRIEEVRSDVDRAATSVLAGVDGIQTASLDHLSLLDERAATALSNTDDRLNSLAGTAASVDRSLSALRSDLSGRDERISEELEMIRARSDEALDATRSLLAAEGGTEAGLATVTARLDALDRSGDDHTNSIAEQVSAIRIEVLEALEDLGEPVSAITARVDALDLGALTTQIQTAATDQRRSAQDLAASISGSTEDNQFIRQALDDLAVRVASLDLEAVKERLQSIEGNQRDIEQRLATSLSGVHAAVDAFDVEPVLLRLDAIETQSGETEDSLHAAIADARSAALSIDLASVSGRIADLERRNREQADALGSQIATVVEQFDQTGLAEVQATVQRLVQATEDQSTSSASAIADLARTVDQGSLVAWLEALDQRANHADTVTEEIRNGLQLVREQLTEVDLTVVTDRLDRLVDSVHATDEATRASIATEMQAVAGHLQRVDMSRVERRLEELAATGDRLDVTVGTELAATVERVRSVVAEETELRISTFSDAHEARSRELLREVQSLRDVVTTDISTATDAHRAALVDRIDRLGNTVVDRLDDSRSQVDGLAAQVASIHGVFARTDQGSAADLAGRLDSSLETLAERIGAALRDLRTDLVSTGNSGDPDAIISAVESSIGRLAQRFEAENARILEAVGSHADSDRLRRIDGSITEIRRDFEVLRRLSDRAVAAD